MVSDPTLSLESFYQSTVVGLGEGKERSSSDTDIDPSKPLNFPKNKTYLPKTTGKYSAHYCYKIIFMVLSFIHQQQQNHQTKQQ